MPATTHDTIAAIATPPGRGGIGIVRVSGPGVPAVAGAVLGALPAPRLATRARFLDSGGGVLDDGIALYFPAPHSYTGEHVLELQGHGGSVVMAMLLECVLAAGARHARPGEFSERAFLNDKLDLAQAEAVADLIDAASEQGARAAMRSLSGEFSECVHALVEAVTDLRAHVEAAIDFPEEEIDFLADGVVERRTQELLAELDALAVLARGGRALRDGLSVVIAGPPNAGKSSLLNRLAGHEAAIVTDIPGTTRDLLREQVTVDGMPLHVVDTAGLRESGDVIEQEGMRRAHAEIAAADRVLLVVEADMQAEPVARLMSGLGDRAVTIVRNKIDLTGEAAAHDRVSGNDRISLSVKTGAGLELLRRHLCDIAGMPEGPSGAFSARRRHLDALERARMHISLGFDELRARRAGDLLAEELRLAQSALGEVTGEVHSDALLGRIFAAFCIGK